MSDPRDRTDAEILDGLALANVLRMETSPEDPPHEFESVRANLRAQLARFGMWSVRIRDVEGVLVAGTVTVKDWKGDDNPDIGRLDVSVHPAHRRRGVGTVVAAQQLALARALGQTRLHAITTERMPVGASLLERMGAVAVQASHRNELAVADVDVDLLRGWIHEAGQRAADYELVSFDGPVPAEMIDGNVELLLILNTAPRDGLTVNDFTITAAEIREGEAQFAAIGMESWSIFARHRVTGDWAGLHNVAWGPFRPGVVHVGSTGVKPEHRGHGLGKWMKAAMTLRILAERPEVTTVRTGNADSNEAMLGINRAMGYRGIEGTTTWELSCHQLESWLTARGVEIPDVRAAVDAQRKGWVNAPDQGAEISPIA